MLYLILFFFFFLQQPIQRRYIIIPLSTDKETKFQGG